MSWQDDAMAEQEAADALWTMGEAEWRDIMEGGRQMGKTELTEEIIKKKRKEIIMKKGFSGLLVAGAIAFAGLAIGAGVFISNYLQESDVTFTVKSKERVVDRDGDGSRYLIWSDDETFENVDSLFKGKFNSSDLYGKLEEGKTYDCKVYGWRNGFFSWYRNIISCKEA